MGCISNRLRARLVHRALLVLAVVPVILPSTVVAQTALTTIDAAWTHDELVNFVDTWNGGPQKQNGTTGMGTYAPGWSGLFVMDLDRQWNFISMGGFWTNDLTIISQSRAIYLNVEAYRWAAPIDKPRFLDAVQKGANYLIAKAKDPNTYGGQPGGFWWGLNLDGATPPDASGFPHIGGTAPRDKMAYGQVHTIFSLAQAYSVTGDPDHLAGALYGLDSWLAHFTDTGFGTPGAFLPTQDEAFTTFRDPRNLDYMTHWLEASMTLWDVLPAGHPRKAEVAQLATEAGDFVTGVMYHDMAGSTTKGYIPWFYEPNWTPHQTVNLQYATPGHAIEIAWLLSRGVERGFNAAWMNTANKLLNFALEHGFDNNPSSPTYGAIKYDAVKFDGTPVNPQPENIIWWPTSEAARTLMHYAVVRGRSDLWDEYRAAMRWLRNYQIDPVYGGWYQSIIPTTRQPDGTTKGTVWTAGYHEAMLYAETMRLAPVKSALVYAADTPPTINGAVDPGWDAGPIYHGVTSSSGTISSASDASGSFKVMWDKLNIYLLVDVVDDSKRSDSVDPRDDDSVEVYIDADNSRSGAYGANDGQWIFGYGRTSVVSGVNTASRTAGVAYAVADPSPTNYRMEIKIPWTAIGITPPSSGGPKIGLEIHVNDDDDGGARDGTLTWNDTGNLAETVPSTFGIGVLSGSPPAVPDAIPPKVTGMELVTDARGRGTLVRVTFNEPLSPSSGNTIANYSLGVVRPGREPLPVRLKFVSFIAGPNVVELHPAKPLAAGKLYTLTLNSPGLVDFGGNQLDGNGDATAGDNWQRTFGRGRRMTYTDVDGDRVRLVLRGSGLVDVVQSASGEPVVTLTGVDSASVFQGTVKKGRSGNGSANLAGLSNPGGAQIEFGSVFVLP